MFFAENNFPKKLKWIWACVKSKILSDWDRGEHIQEALEKRRQEVLVKFLSRNWPHQ